MPKQRQDRIGLLVVRASVERGLGLVVQLLDVDPPRPDRVVGLADSPETACRLLSEWLEALVAASAEGDAAREDGGDARVMRP